jgi:lipid-binding SYLF domain-containing protein
MRKSLLVTAAVTGLLFAGASALAQSGQGGYAGSPAGKKDSIEQQQLLTKTKAAVDAMRADPNVGPGLNTTLAQARGVVIFPNLVKAGLIVGTAAGEGVMLVRQAQGWSDPVFYYVADASLGLQIGVETGSVLFAVMNEGAVEKLLHGDVNLGSDVSVAAGQADAALASSFAGVDMVAFARQSGAYAGVSLKGGVIKPSQNDNDAYYGKGTTTDQIIRMTADRPEQRDLKVALEPKSASSYGSGR